MYNDVIHHHVAPSTTVVAKRLVAADNRRPLRSRRINAEIRRHGEFGGRRINAEARRHGDFGGRRINAEARRHGDSWDAGLTRRLGDTETLGYAGPTRRLGDTETPGTPDQRGGSETRRLWGARRRRGLGFGLRLTQAGSGWARTAQWVRYPRP